jgi:tetratricopeptide (TPR) repeat protein
LATAILLGILVIGAPMACGAVHRLPFVIALGLTAPLALATTWLATRCKSKLATAVALAFPLFFLLTAAAQIIPLPANLRALLDPNGSALLALAGLKGAQPLSLDPPETYAEFAKAAAALCVALAALVLASGRRLRFVAPGLVASAGLLALAVGLGHRAAAEAMIYGHFPTSGGLPVGPFINPNHTAEFLELSAFAALAFAFSRTTRDGQRVWKLIAAVLAAGAITTLSRGSVLALGAGALAWFALAPRSDEGEPFHRSKFVAALLALVVVVGITIGFGGDQIIAEFHGTVGDNLSKFAVAKDALPMVATHPAGIGLGAFSRAYPVYQHLPMVSWFQFVEVQPVSILIETGVAATALLLGLWLLVARRFWKQARRDRVEASLVAAVIAVLAHNTVDFGLETLGVLLPFCALLGTIFGRQDAIIPPPRRDIGARDAPLPPPRRDIGSQDAPLPPPRRDIGAHDAPLRPPRPASARGEGWGEGRLPVFLSVVAFLSTLAGILLFLAPSARDFDAQLQSPPSPSTRALAHAASLAHPTDYAYALAEARLEPRGPAKTSTQTRLRMLNRAMLLCPRCMGAHEEAARDLWRLGRRQQSLLEWKIVVTESRGSLGPVLDGLLAVGAKPDELATLADDQNRLGLSRYLLAHGAIDAATKTLNQTAQQEGAELYLVQAQIFLAAKDIPAARKASQRALELEPRNPRAVQMSAEIALLDPKATSEALAILQTGLRFAPSDVNLNRMVLSLLIPTDKYQAIDQALANLRAALAEAGAPSTEANLTAAQIFERRGQFRRAMSEYQAALSHAPDNIGIHLALARAAEQIGGIASAVDAYTNVLRRDPANQEAKSALARIQHDKKDLEVDSILRAGRGAEVK